MHRKKLSSIRLEKKITSLPLTGSVAVHTSIEIIYIQPN